MATKLGITSIEGWYQITFTTMLEQGAAGLTKRYNNSVSKLLTTIYPEYKQRCRDFVNQVVRNLQLSKVEEVLNVPQEYPYGVI